MKLFIFDMGGVLADRTTVIPAMAAAWGITAEDFFRGASSDPAVSHTSPYNLGDIGALMRGALSVEQFWNNFSRRTGITVEGDPWYDYFKPLINGGTLKIIGDLKAAGRKTVCGTNTLDSHYRSHIERGDYAPFDKVYASHLMGVIKPDPEFWRFILREEGADPSGAFFIDDNQENVEGAAKLGLAVHLFTGPAKLRAALEEWIQVSP
jgi:putative hydrolase of the HAD superfamily